MIPSGGGLLVIVRFAGLLGAALLLDAPVVLFCRVCHSAKPIGAHRKWRIQHFIVLGSLRTRLFPAGELARIIQHPSLLVFAQCVHHRCVENDNHRVGEPAVEARAEVVEIDEMKAVPKRPNELPKPPPASSAPAGFEIVGDRLQRLVELVWWNRFLPLFHTPHFACEFIERGLLFLVGWEVNDWAGHRDYPFPNHEQIFPSGSMGGS